MDDVTRPADSPTVLSGDSSDSPTVLSSGSTRPGGARPHGPRPAPGQSFGPYVIERPLGSGGMGDVYEASHVEHGRRVALKILGQRLAGPDDLARFLREGELAASITHPNTVYVYGSEEIAGSPVIAMELLSGGTLKDLVQARGPLPPKEAVDLILQVIAGLEAAQGSGILHRDIKPANCFIDRDGSVKVGDFGLSISSGGREGAATGMFQGTPQFAPPEQIRGEVLDVRADIYAVGATLFYLLTSKPPFEDTDLTTLISRVQAEAARSPREMRAGVPQALADIVSRCLNKDRTARPSAYAELEDLLRSFSSAAAAPAGLGRRTLAGIIDGICLSFIIAPMTMPLVFRQQGASLQWAIRVVQILSAVAYFGVLEGLWGASLGKAMCAIAVAREDGRRPGLALALGRAAIYQLPAILGLIPLAIIGSKQFTRFVLERPGAAMLIGSSTYIVVILLFSTARKTNGYAAFHDLVTGTRVVRRLARASRAASDDMVVAASPLQGGARQCGPFEVTGTIGRTDEGELLAAVDPRLKRDVWIHEQRPGAPAISPLLRDLGRSGRLRWLGGRRTHAAAWDAYEALGGGPLERIASPQPWRVVKGWLIDLATEIDAGLADASLAPLTLDRVWVTPTGHAKLLDFRAPGVTNASREEPATLIGAQAWLSSVAERGLRGQAAEATGGRRVLPLSGRVVLDRLSSRTFKTSAEVVSAIVGVLPQPDKVDGWRRAWSVGLGGITPLVLAALGLFASFALRNSPSDAQALARCLDRLSAISTPGHDADAAERAALETYIASQYRQTIDKELTWSMVVGTTRLVTYRPLAMGVVERHPSVTPDELAAAKATLGSFLAEDAKERDDGARRAQIALAVVPTFLFVAGVGIAAAFGIVLAAIFRGGLLLRGFGIAVVNRRGERASRLRAALRAVVAWAPALVFAGAIYVSHVTFTNDTYHARHPWMLVAAVAALAVFLVGAAFAALRPTRGLQDYATRTFLVPR